MITPYAEMLSQRGGMAACGDNLGVFVGTDINKTPKGWIFILLEDATPEKVQEALNVAKMGRKAWPTK